MKIERSQVGEPQSELPVPTEGQFTQIASELLVDRIKFTSESLRHMQEENGELYLDLIRIALFTPRREVALDWALMYYELNARPGRAEGVPIVRVSREPIDSTTSIQSRALGPLIDRVESFSNPNSGEASRALEELRQAMEEIDSMDKEFRDQDAERSPEFSRFWSLFFLLSARMAMEDPKEQVPRHHFEPLNLIMRSLHQQIKRNQFKRDFPKV